MKGVCVRAHDEDRPSYLGAWQDVGIGLYPCDNLAQDDPVCKHVHLQRSKRVHQQYIHGKMTPATTVWNAVYFYCYW